MTSALACRGLSLSLGGKPVIVKLDLDIEMGSVLAILGGSGSGKTSLLRMITGLIDPDSGEIDLDGAAVFRRGRSVPPEHRAIDMVFQDYALWPHLSVRDNLAFGLKAQRLDARTIALRVDHALDVTRLAPYADRLPSMLSGGQQQRVAIARCLAARPKVIVFDEPLSNLDAALRDDVRIEILRLVRAEGMTAIYVTHDQAEALAVSDRLAVMRAGRVEQCDRPEIVYERPANTYVAGFLGGFSVLPGTADSVTFRLADGSATLELAEPAPTGAVALVVRPEDARMADLTNALSGEVVDCSFIGRCFRVTLRVAGVMLRLDWPRREAVGGIVRFGLPADRCRAVPVERG